ncbi:MAG: hypothetical protein R3B70_38210 [Polyangiaceae bacterium]
MLRWCVVAAACGALGAIGACASYDPIKYTERVPYEWETWSPDAGADADADAGDDASPPATPGASAAPAEEPQKTSERTVFPASHFWNKDISNEPVDPRGYKYIESVGLDTPLHADFSAPEPWSKKIGYGIPYQYVSGDQKKVPVEMKWASESDPGPYPIPDNPLIERGDDRHILMIDKDNWVLYELYEARLEGGKWKASSGAIFDLKSTKSRPAGWTSADAAGLAIFPGLVRADEVIEQGAIRHALRFTVKVTQKAYVWPASHYASKKEDPDLPPMGMWVRLKSSFAIDGFSPNIQVILTALKKHGMILADNGSNFFVSGAPDKRWKADELRELLRVKGRDLEVIKTGDLVTK